MVLAASSLQLISAIHQRFSIRILLDFSPQSSGKKTKLKYFVDCVFCFVFFKIVVLHEQCNTNEMRYDGLMIKSNKVQIKLIITITFIIQPFFFSFFINPFNNTPN